MNCVYVWMIFTASNFDISSSIFCVEQVKIFHAGSTNYFPNFSKLQLLRLSTTFVTNRSWSLVYIQHDLCSLNLFSNSSVVACSFLVARVIKNTRRKPFEFKWPEVRFNRKQTSMDHPSVPYNKLLTNLASSSRTGEYWPSVVLYGPRCARSVLPRPRANIPRYGPRARLVRG